MSSLLIDSGPVILQLCSHKRTVQLLRSLGVANRLSISAVTRIEVRARMLPVDRFATQKLLSCFITYDVDREIADRTADIIATLRTRGVSVALPDAIIACTAIGHNLTLLTFNRAHFEIIPGLSLYPLADNF